MPSLGTVLKNRRLALGLTQQEVAKAAGVNASHVCRLEQNKVQDPGGHRFRAVARALETTPEVLYREAGLLPAPPAPFDEESVRIALLRSAEPYLTPAELESVTIVLQSFAELARRHREETAAKPPPPNNHQNMIQ